MLLIMALGLHLCCPQFEKWIVPNYACHQKPKTLFEPIRDETLMNLLPPKWLQSISTYMLVHRLVLLYQAKRKTSPLLARKAWGVCQYKNPQVVGILMLKAESTMLSNQSASWKAQTFVQVVDILRGLLPELNH